MRRPTEALRATLGQFDLRTALITGGLGLLLSCVSTTTGIVYTRWTAAEDVRRQTDQNTADIAEMRGEVRRMAAQGERVAAAFDGVRNAVDEIKSSMHGRGRIRPAGGP